MINISIHKIAYFSYEFYRTRIRVTEYHIAKILQWKKLVTLKPLRMNIEI